MCSLVALLYVCHIAKEEQTLHTYLKKGWEGTHHHDNTGRSRTNAIKKDGSNVVYPVISSPHKNIHLCVWIKSKKKSKKKKRRRSVHTRLHMWKAHAHALIIRPTHTHTHTPTGAHTFLSFFIFLLIHLFRPHLICHSDDKLK